MKVSAVIPVYNAEGTIAAAVESALAQRFDGGFEVIVVNDGSTDGTRAVLEKFGARIAVIDQPRQGVSAARNAGIKAAAGEYVALLDADDEWTEDKLAKTVQVLEQNASCVAVFSDASVVKVPGRILPAKLYRERVRSFADARRAAQAGVVADPAQLDRGSAKDVA